MDPLQYIDKLFCILFVFCAGTKSHSQREIHPLEPLYTYDYALKTYNNLAIISPTLHYKYWQLENFMMPKGVNVIEEFQFYPADIYMPIRRTGDNGSEDKKYIHTLNSKNGFIRKTLYLQIQGNDIVDTIYVKNYKIDVDSLNTVIIIKKTLKNVSNETYSYQYTFNNKTKNLTNILTDSTEINFKYSNDNSSLSAVTNIDLNNNITIFTLNNYFENIEIEPTDKVSFNDRKIYLNKEKEVLKIHSNYSSIHIKEGIQSKSYYNQLMYSNNHISYSWNTDPTSLDENSKERTGVLLFNGNKKLIEFHSSENNLQNLGLDINAQLYGKKWRRQHGVYKILKRKNLNRWTLKYLLAFRKERSNEIKYNTVRNSSNYKIEENVFYYGNRPFLIYK